MSRRLQGAALIAVLSDIHAQREVTTGAFRWPAVWTWKPLHDRGLTSTVTIRTPGGARNVLRLTQKGLEALGLPGIGADGVELIDLRTPKSSTWRTVVQIDRLVDGDPEECWGDEGTFEGTDQRAEAVFHAFAADVTSLTAGTPTLAEELTKALEAMLLDPTPRADAVRVARAALERARRTT